MDFPGHPAGHFLKGIRLPYCSTWSYLGDEPRVLDWVFFIPESGVRKIKNPNHPKLLGKYTESYLMRPEVSDPVKSWTRDKWPTGKLLTECRVPWVDLGMGNVEIAGVPITVPAMQICQGAGDMQQQEET